MHWNQLNSEEQLQQLVERSKELPQVIFKHSTRCSISSVALQRLDKAQQPQATEFHLLDVLQARPLSNKVAEIFHVAHESPQVLVIRNGECIYDESHLGINMKEIAGQVQMA